MRVAPNSLQLLLLSLAGWISQHQQEVIDYLVEENRVLKEQLGGRRLRLNARGEFRTCLYGTPEADLREALRSGAADSEIHKVIAAAIGRRLEDGRAAEAAREGPISMARIGG